MMAEREKKTPVVGRRLRNGMSSRTKDDCWEERKECENSHLSPVFLSICFSTRPCSGVCPFNANWARPRWRAQKAPLEEEGALLVTWFVSLLNGKRGGINCIMLPLLHVFFHVYKRILGLLLLLLGCHVVTPWWTFDHVNVIWFTVTRSQLKIIRLLFSRISFFFFLLCRRCCCCCCCCCSSCCWVLFSSLFHWTTRQHIHTGNREIVSASVILFGTPWPRARNEWHKKCQ